MNSKGGNNNNNNNNTNSNNASASSLPNTTDNPHNLEGQHQEIELQEVPSSSTRNRGKRANKTGETDSDSTRTAHNSDIHSESGQSHPPPPPPPPPNPHSNVRLDNIPRMPPAGRLIPVLVVLGCIGALLIMILVPLSFSYVEIDEWAFKKSKVNNKVDTTKVYGNGRYFFGLGKKVVAFERRFQLVSFTDNSTLSVFTLNGLALGLECTFQYRLDPTRLATLYEKYGTVYKANIISIATAALKNAAPKYTVDDYVTRWSEVADTLASELSVTLNAVGVEMPKEKFQIREIHMPDSIQAIYLATAIRLQENQRKEYAQRYQQIIKETELQVTAITAQSTSVSIQAAGTAERIVAEAEAEALRMEQEANGQALAAIISAVGLSASDSVLRAKLIRLVPFITGQANNNSTNSFKFLVGVNANAILPV